MKVYCLDCQILHQKKKDHLTNSSASHEKHTSKWLVGVVQEVSKHTGCYYCPRSPQEVENNCLLIKTSGTSNAVPGTLTGAYLNVFSLLRYQKTTCKFLKDKRKHQS